MYKLVNRLVLIALASGLLVLATSSPAQADHGFFAGFVGLDTGSGNTFYGLLQPGANQLTAFDGLDLGVVTSLTLSGGEGETFKNSGDNVTGVNLNYVVYPTGSPSSSFNFVVLNFTADALPTFNDAAGNTFGTPGDQKWANIASTPDLSTGLAPGNYTLEVYLSGFGQDSLGNEQDFFLNNFTETAPPNYKATFTIVPEPTTALLVGLSLTGAAFLRRRRS